ncbi:hypothetical protein BH23THE1_BH23THE1_24810 [soil metagenome]
MTIVAGMGINPYEIVMGLDSNFSIIVLNRFTRSFLLHMRFYLSFWRLKLVKTKSIH